MQEVRAKFIILRKIRFSEADLIIHGLSVKGGKHSFIAKAALKSKRRFGGGVLEPGHYVEFGFNLKKLNAMHVLTDARLIADLGNNKKSIEQLEFMLKVLELVGKIAQEGDENSEYLFNLVGHCLRAIENSTPEQVPLVKLGFYLKLLYQQGVLEFEPWMKPVLQVDLKSILQNAETVDKEIERLDGIEQMVEHYADNAGI